MLASTSVPCDSNGLNLLRVREFCQAWHAICHLSAVRSTCVEYRVGTFVSNRLIQVSQDGVLTNMALNVGIEIKVAAFHCRSSLKDDSHKLDRQAIAYLAFLTSDSVPQFPDAVIDWFSIASYDKVQLKETVARTS